MPVYRFGPFRLDTDGYRLTKGETAVPASPRQLDLLACLASEPSRLITRDELFERLWSGVAVTDNALTQLVSELRQTLGDSSGDPRTSRPSPGEAIASSPRWSGWMHPQPCPPPPQPSRWPAERRDVEPRRHAGGDRRPAAARGAGRLAGGSRHSELQAGDRAGSDLRGRVCRPGERALLAVRRSRASRSVPTRRCSRVAISEARQGLALAPDYAEAHATLAYLLAGVGAARREPARRRGRRLRCSPNTGDITSGSATPRGDRSGSTRWPDVCSCMPPFPFAYFADGNGPRGASGARHRAPRAGGRDRAPATARSRRAAAFRPMAFTGCWDRCCSSRGDVAGALVEFEREARRRSSRPCTRASMPSRRSTHGLGQACGGPTSPRPTSAFRESLQLHAEQVRPHLGLRWSRAGAARRAPPTTRWAAREAVD